MSYQIVGKKCGTVSFQSRAGTIKSESLTSSSKMTSNAIEGGSSIEDHVQLNPEQMQISGVVVKNADQYQDALNRMWKARDLVSYYGRIKLIDCVITSLKTNMLPDNKNGFTFTATLQKANIVSGQYVEMGEVKLMSQQDQKSTTKNSAQTSSTKAAGLKTTTSKNISNSSYAAYVNSYNSSSSSGASQRTSQSYNGI